MENAFIILGFILLLSCNSKNSNKKIPDLAQLISEFESIREADDEASWPNFDPEKLSKEIADYEKVQSRLNEIEVEDLNISDQINLDMLNLVVEDEKAQLEFEHHLMPLNSEGGFLAGIVYAIRDSKVNSSEEFLNYRNKLTDFPDYINRRIEHMRRGIKEDKVSPKLIIENCLKLVDQVMKSDPSETIFTSPVLDNQERKDEVVEIVTGQLIPAYQRLSEFLSNEYLVGAPSKIGIAGVNEGKAYYEHRTRYFTTFDITPKEVFETGMDEVKRIRGEMEQIIKDLKFEGSFDDFIEFLRNDPQFYPTSGEALLKEASWITSQIQGELPKYFTHMPRMPLTVKPVPDALAPNYTGGRYSGGSFDNHKAGQYWVNTYNLKSRPLYVLPSLSLHEGVPGHHTQIMLSGELEDVPSFRTNTYLSAFGEGWALYTEYLGKEMGIYKTPYEDFGRLTYEMWRACRLVVDPGMHYMGWTREEAIKFMAENTALSMHEINTEINRYIGWPAQAVSYKMGELKIRALRKKAESMLGDKFDIRAFHDKVLENGSIPLNTLERIIDQYIEDVNDDSLKE